MIRTEPRLGDSVTADMSAPVTPTHGISQPIEGRAFSIFAVMFEQLLGVLRPTQVSGPPDNGTPPTGLRAALGSLAGSTLESGLYRVHTRSSAAAADTMVAAAYPDFTGRIACFGMDWLGRQFSLDTTRGHPGDPAVLLYDIGAGQALEIPTTFSAFHDEELTQYTNEALASDFFGRWLRAHPDPVRFQECISYKVPLFLGGIDDLDNLERSDLDVYWSLTGQIRVSIRG